MAGPAVEMCAAGVVGVLLAIAFVVLSSRRQRGEKSVDPVGTLPLPPRAGQWLPVIGESLDFLRSLWGNGSWEFVEARLARAGGAPVARTHLFGNDTVIMSGPEANRFVFGNDGRLVRPTWPTSALKLLGQATSRAGEDPVYLKRLRRLIYLSAASPETLKKLVDRLDALTERHFAAHWSDRRSINLCPLIKQHLLDVGASLFAGLEDDSPRKRQLDRLFLAFNSGVLAARLYFPGTRYYNAFRARAGLLELVRETMDERKAAVAKGLDLPPDMLSHAMLARDDLGQPFADDEILDLVILLMFAGHDTVNSAIALACKYLSLNPASLEEVVKEQQVIFELKTKENRLLTWEDLQTMKHTWSAMQESIRLQPPLLGVFYVALQDFEYAKFRIPKGWTVFLSISHCHLNKENFTNATAFHPSRFIGSDPIMAAKPNTFVPFGGGRHMCPGIDVTKTLMLVFFHHLVVKFKWSLVDPLEHISIHPSPSPVNGFPSLLEERSEAKRLNPLH